MIKILVDSGSDINEIQAKEMGITLIPIEVRFGDEEYLDGVNLLPKEFYEKLVTSKELPKTSMINPFRFEEEFEKATKDGSEAIYIALSSRLSGTYNAACEAASKFNGKIFVVDSLSAAAGERLLCELALRLINEGKTAQEVVDELNQSKVKLQIFAMVDTLKYLKKGGRVSPLVAFAGEMLNIKPIVSVVDGEVKLVGKAMGSKKSNLLLNNLVEQKGGVDFDMPYCTLYSGNDETLAEKYLVDSAPIWKGKTDVTAHVLGSTIGTHVGPGAVGVVFFAK